MGGEENSRRNKREWRRDRLKETKSIEDQEGTTQTKEDYRWRRLGRIWHIGWKGKNSYSQRQVRPRGVEQESQRLLQVQEQEELFLQGSREERRCARWWCQDQWEWRGLRGEARPKDTSKLLKRYPWDHSYRFKGLQDRGSLSLLRTTAWRRSIHCRLQTLASYQ